MNTEPVDAMDVFLQPGEFYFGDRHTRIRTLLGSCVSITIWHPDLLIGGMCHFMLPRQPHYKGTEKLDGKYAEDAVLLFMEELKRTNTSPSEYTTKLFGGGNMFPNHKMNIKKETIKTKNVRISTQNINYARKLMKQFGFKIDAESLGGTGHRNVNFEVWNGDVWVKHVSGLF